MWCEMNLLPKLPDLYYYMFENYLLHATQVE